MKKIFTLDDIRNSKVFGLNPHLFAESAAVVKKSKYGNKKTEVNGIVFHSVKEANYYKKLLLMQKAGIVGLIEMQVPYELNPGGTHSLKYISDFEYIETKTGKKIVADVKGFRTREYLKKRRLMKTVHNIEILEA